MAQKTLKFNETDVTSYSKVSGYVVGEKKILGPNGGVMMDGSTVEHVVATKDTLDVPIEALSETDTYAIMNMLRNSSYAPYVRIYYYSTNYGAYRTSTFMRSEVANTHWFQGTDGVDYYTEKVLSFVEK